jgi:hypothetical protein
MVQTTFGTYRMAYRTESKPFGLKQKFKPAIKALFSGHDPWLEVAKEGLKQGIDEESEKKYVKRIVLIGETNDIFEILMSKPSLNIQDPLAQKLRKEYMYWANHEKKEPCQRRVVNEHVADLIAKSRQLLESGVIDSAYANKIIHEILDDFSNRPSS